MSQGPRRRLDPNIIEADELAWLAAKGFNDYNPMNSAYRPEHLAEKEARLEALRAADLYAQNAQNAARSALIEGEWEFHNAVIGMKEQIIAQYGNSSEQVRAIGLKKKSDRKRPSRVSGPTRTVES